MIFPQTTRRQTLECLPVHVKQAQFVDNAMRMIIWSTDTDVAVICSRTVKELNIQQLFFYDRYRVKEKIYCYAHDCGQPRQWYSIALLNLHALTGCDSNSAPSEHGKKDNV